MEVGVWNFKGKEENSQKMGRPSVWYIGVCQTMQRQWDTHRTLISSPAELPQATTTSPHVSVLIPGDRFLPGPCPLSECLWGVKGGN